MEMLNSERKELLDTIAALRQDKDAAYAAALRHVNAVVLRAKYLDNMQKDLLLSDEAEIYDFWMVSPVSYQPLIAYFRRWEAMEDIEAAYGGYPYGTLQFAQAMIDDYIRHKKQKKVKRTEEILYMKYPHED